MNTNEEVFQAAAALPAAERPAYLDVACAGQPKIRVGVEALLLSHDASGFMEVGTRDAGSPSPAENGGRSRWEARSGERIGRYRLLQEIGHGGFGIVYSAEQKEPVRRRVALKVLKRGMDTREIVTRFALERQALALMNHPNVAMVFDGGETEDGRPYFVMEYVDGAPMTTFCDNHRMSINERIELMIQVCRGLQHSHQKGLIHCDVKPANILVMMQDGHAIPKLIDYGIAKATTFLTFGTLIEDPGKWAGSPVYMSPEQLRRDTLDVDVRTDIYSSGALLYELLTGLTPFDRGKLMAEGFGRMEQMIREEDPPKPSARLIAEKENLTKIAENRGTTPARLKSSLRRELDWIVMRAMAKNRERRYQSALELADDLNRYLKNKPVKAGPPTMRYRTSKFAQRHHGRLFLAAAVVLLIAVGMIKLRLTLRQNAEDTLAVEIFTGPDVETDALSFHLARIKPRLVRVADKLAEIALNQRYDDRVRLHAAIAVLPQRPEVLRVLIKGLLELDPTDSVESQELDDYLTILRKYRDEDEVNMVAWQNLINAAWDAMEIYRSQTSEKDSPGERAPLGAIVLLATLDPHSAEWRKGKGLLREAVGWVGLSPRRLSHFRRFLDVVVQPVHFQDANLQERMNDVIGSPDQGITDFDLFTLRDFKSEAKAKYDEKPITILKGIELAVNLEQLDFDFNKIESLEHLRGMTKLKEIDLRGNRVTSAAPLAGMKNLKMLDIRDNKLSDLSPLTQLTALKELQLSGNPITDLKQFEHLKPLTSLTMLEISRCGLEDIAFLSNLSNLKMLKLKENKIKDLNPLAELKHLTELDISYNPEVKDLSPLLKLADLNLKTLIVTLDGVTETVDGEMGGVDEQGEPKVKPITGEQIRRLIERKEKSSNKDNR